VPIITYKSLKSKIPQFTIMKTNTPNAGNLKAKIPKTAILIRKKLAGGIWKRARKPNSGMELAHLGRLRIGASVGGMSGWEAGTVLFWL
jgi:hypothetical protein